MKPEPHLLFTGWEQKSSFFRITWKEDPVCNLLLPSDQDAKILDSEQGEVIKIRESTKVSKRKHA